MDAPPPDAVTVQPPRPKKEPTTIEQLIPVIVRHAIKNDEGLTVSRFNEIFLSRVQNMVPETLGRMRDQVVQEYLLDTAHALYIAVVVGNFAGRPVLCGVRATELAAELVERVLGALDDKPEKRYTAIRGANLLAGLAMLSVRIVESATLGSQTLDGFTANFERAVVTTYGLKTQAEAAGGTPWTSQAGNALDKRIGRAINVMSNVFGDYIGEHGHSMNEQQYVLVTREFDAFMERFAPYIEGGRSAAEQRRRKAEQDAAQKLETKVEPLHIDKLRTRPAGVEMTLSDGRILFVSTNDARRIGQAADAETEETGKRERQAMKSRKKGYSPE